MAVMENSRFFISEPSDVGTVRRAAGAMAEKSGFSLSRGSDLGIVITELSTNILRHGDRGELLLRPVEEGAARGIEILAVDRGKGMANFSQCLTDGFSTSGGSGIGLGAISRLSDFSDFFSTPGHGTCCLSILWSAPLSSAESTIPHPAEVGSVCVALRGEKVCGDAWGFDLEPDRVLFLVADGLGHGAAAAEASHEAIRIFKSHTARPPLGVLEEIHGGLKKTRGAAIAVGELDLSVGEVHYCGVGNISGALCGTTQQQGLASMNGTVGHEVRIFRQFAYACPAYRAIILHSDGVSNRWNLHEPPYSGLLERHPSLIAGVLYRDFARARDDATVMVIRSGSARKGRYAH